MKDMVKKEDTFRLLHKSASIDDPKNILAGNEADKDYD